MFGTIQDTCRPLCFGLLPDKSARSYDTFFSQLYHALKRNNLNLNQAKTFISDFEENIPKFFKKWFTHVKVQGCLFHFGKAIWKQVSSNGMKMFYSNKSEDKQFGNYIRLILGISLYYQI